MSEAAPALALSTWNIAAHDQVNRIGGIAEYVATKEPGITILTELTAVRGLREALTRELGNAYSLATVDTGSKYEDGIGLLLTGQGCTIDAVEAVPTRGEKMPYVMRADLTTPLGAVNVAAMRGAYIAGQGTPLSSGSAERKAQYQTAVEAVKGREGLPFIVGDMNSFVRTHDAIFRRNGFRRLTDTRATWPDRQGLKVATPDARILAAPFLLLRRGVSLDAIYGNDSVESIRSSADATGMSDHLHVTSVVIKAA